MRVLSLVSEHHLVSPSVLGTREWVGFSFTEGADAEWLVLVF